MTVVDAEIVGLFGGPGGWDVALEWLGHGDRAVGIEWDKTACETRRAAGFATIEADVRCTPPHNFRGVRGLIGSPPCPTFSAAGKGSGRAEMPHLLAAIDHIASNGWCDPWQLHDWDDPRTPLVLEPLRWIIELEPEWVTLEQVEDALPVWQAYARILTARGYSTWAGSLNAERYGVPQTRTRAFLIASRTRTVQPPPPTHQQYVKGVPAQHVEDLFGTLQPWVSMAEALGWDGDVGFPRLDDTGDSDDGYRTRDWRATTEPAQTLSAKARSWVRRERSGERSEEGFDPHAAPSQTLTSKARSWERRTVATGMNTMSVSRDLQDMIPYERPISAPAPTLDTHSGSKWTIGDEGHRQPPMRWKWDGPATTVAGDPRISARAHHADGSQGRNSKTTDQARSGDYDGTRTRQAHRRRSRRAPDVPATLPMARLTVETVRADRQRRPMPTRSARPRGCAVTASVARADALRLPIADASVDLIVTSPPYFALRSYQDAGEHYDGQIGSEPTPQAFLDALWAVTAECWRVLKPTGSLFVNLGDKSSGAGGGHPGSDAEIAGRPIPTDRSARWHAVAPSTTGIRPKSLMGLPWRYAIGCIDGEADPDGIGWILRSEIVWDKPNGMPESVTDRVRRSHEQWFHLTKAAHYYAAIDEIRQPHTGGSNPGRADGTSPPGGKIERMVAAGDRGGTIGATNPDLFNPLGKLPGSVWRIPSEPLVVPAELDVDHFAAFPSEWPRRLILGWSPPAICCACGQGRVPVTRVDHEKYRDAPSTGRPHRQDLTTVGGGFNNPGYIQTRSSAEILGYACPCAPYTDHERPGRSQGALNKDPRHAAWDGADTGRRTVKDRVYDLDGWTPPPSRPAVVLDPFGGTGTTAMVAKALGRVGISIDMSADYCRLADWRIHHSDHDLKAIARTAGEPAARSEADQRAQRRAGQQTLL